MAGLWTEEIFHIPFIAQWSDEGRIFDPEAMTNLIPVVLHVAVILNLNTLYQSIAHWLTGQYGSPISPNSLTSPPSLIQPPLSSILAPFTLPLTLPLDNENPRTSIEYENSVILKRFLFESFDCYIALFYLAFFQFDVIRLRVELVGMYTTDSLRRTFLETIVPAALAWVSPQTHFHLCPHLRPHLCSSLSHTLRP